MKKGVVLGLFLILFLISLVSLNFVSALDCKESSSEGYNNRAYYCNTNVNCASGCSLHEAGRCESGPRNFQCNSANGVLWQYSGNRCKRSFICSDSGYTGAYQCSGNDQQAQYRTYSCGSAYNSCPSSDSWITVQNCVYGCTDGSCNTCAPSLTAANYSGQCGSGFSNGCTNSLTLSCASGYHCNVSVGQGICLVNTAINTSYWTDLDGNIISSSNLGDTVKMVASGYGFGTQINYTVYKNATYFWIFHTVDTLSSTSSSDLWKSSEIASGVFFKSKIGNAENTSSTIDVTALDNSKPVATIITPLKDSKVKNGTAISFNQLSSDSDDLLNITWDFGDGTISRCNGYSKTIDSTQCDRQHSYVREGVYTIKLTVQEAARGQSNFTSIKIYVFKQGINVVPIISQPANGVSLGNVRIVNFNASESYVANCTNRVVAQPFFPVGNLNCIYIQAPGLKTYSGNYNITLNWTITTAGSGGAITRYGDWAVNYNQIVEFQQLFAKGGVHTAYLDMIYNA